MSEARDVHCAIFVESTCEVFVVTFRHFEEPGPSGGGEKS